MTLLLGTVGVARAELRPLVAEPVLGEPLSVQITLRNHGPATERVLRELGPEFEFVRYTLTGPDGVARDFNAWALKEPADPILMLPPGGAVTATAELFFDGRRWFFDRAGSYRIADARLALASALRALGRTDEPAAVAEALSPDLERRFPDLTQVIREHVLPEAEAAAPR